MKETVESSDSVVVLDYIEAGHGAHDGVHLTSLAVPVISGSGGPRCDLEANGELEVSDVVC